MRCSVCDRILNDFEATRRRVDTNDFLDICNKCYRGELEELIPSIGRTDLNKFDESSEWEEQEFEDECDSDNWGEDD